MDTADRGFFRCSSLSMADSRSLAPKSPKDAPGRGCALSRENAAVVTAWWAQQDSNLRPADYESAALTN